MQGRLLIDGVDAYTTYGVFVTVGGLNQLVQYPQPKKFTTNNWKERNGEEIDNRPFVYETRNITIPFAIEGDESDYQTFVNSLTSSVYHTFNFAYIGYSIELRYVSCSSFQFGNEIGLFSIELADDGSFLDNYTFSISETSYGDTSNYLNGNSLNYYGIRILDGIKEIKKMPGAKSNLSNSLSYKDGTVYGETDVTFEKRQVTLSMMIEADDTTDFWAQYTAFFYSLSHVDDDTNHEGKWQNLELSEMSGRYLSIYYVGQSISDIYLKTNGGMIATFSLTIVVEDNTDDLTFLTTEDGEIVVTQDNYIVNL